jgi:hypothetical protein
VEPLKLRVLNQFGVSEPLGNPDDIEVIFPYENDSLVKRMAFGHVKILNDSRGEIEVTLSPFDIQGMPQGKNQNFWVKLILDDKFKTVIFKRSLNVETQMVDGEERKVITR